LERFLASFIGVAPGDRERQPLGTLAQDEHSPTGWITSRGFFMAAKIGPSVREVESEAQAACKAFHVASVSRGVAGRLCQSLILLGFILQHVRHEKGQLRTGQKRLNACETWISAW
jgi:hypothetical protein